MMTALRVIRESDALIVVDVQPAFMPGGGLPIEVGDLFIPRVRQMMSRFDIRFATLDRHPNGHISFASSYNDLAPMTALTIDLMNKQNQMRKNHLLVAHAGFNTGDLKTYLVKVGSQVLWPDHAIDGTDESELHPEFHENEFDFVQKKGMNPKCDSYSGFYDNLRRPTGFADVIAEAEPKRLFICGLAFDFCVGYTALDARIALPDTVVFVVGDACRSVNMPASEGRPASIDEMKKKLTEANIQIIDSYNWS